MYSVVASKLVILASNRIVTILCVIIFHCTTFSQTTLIPDPSFEQALIEANIDSNGFNGNILNTDAEGVITLNIFNKNITSLEGIEAFIDLKYLYCYFNNIEYLNVQNNLELEVLDIENNSIEGLDISNNVNLKQVYISNNLLDELDISNNLELELLSCNLNNISELDISQNLNLEVLWCYSNNLSELNFNNNVLLESLFCGENNITNLDISNNSLLQSISCGGNNLQTLDISNCFDLKYLDASGNDLSELDISSNGFLKRLLCNNNIISDFELSTADDLLLFYASGNQLTEIDLSNNSDLKYVHLDGNNLHSVDIRNAMNSEISDFNATNNPNMTCLFVDDIDAVYLNDWNIDAATTFVETPQECNALNVKDDIKADIAFEMYPNPVTDILNISITNTASHFEIYNINGQSVISKSLNKGLNQIDLSTISSGLYMLKVYYENQSLMKKLIID
ncbi:T9SS type A sorting domain-containing protein [Hanstruepera marina]|uniref:T9SS type A sorting domain-containing protein n=1 Tax=Hanstruepera marina TaxID=2873265 RepID=UPI001CA700AD|nr:T9SS type A sorting domain-containing protein [Hanstruepera marina]